LIQAGAHAVQTQHDRKFPTFWNRQYPGNSKNKILDDLKGTGVIY